MLLKVVLEVTETPPKLPLLLLPQLPQLSHKVKELAAVELIVRPTHAYVADCAIGTSQFGIEGLSNGIFLLFADFLSAGPVYGIHD